MYYNKPQFAVLTITANCSIILEIAHKNVLRLCEHKGEEQKWKK